MTGFQVINKTSLVKVSNLLILVSTWMRDHLEKQIKKKQNISTYPK